MKKTVALFLSLILPLAAIPALTLAEAGGYNEAPALAALVEAGELPPVEERLPEDPLVVTPQESVGQYGGIWRQSVTLGTKNHAAHSIGYYGEKSLAPLERGQERDRAEHRFGFLVERRRQGDQLHPSQGLEVVGRHAVHHG